MNIEITNPIIAMIILGAGLGLFFVVLGLLIKWYSPKN